MTEQIVVKNAHLNNLKNIDISSQKMRLLFFAELVEVANPHWSLILFLKKVKKDI